MDLPYFMVGDEERAAVVKCFGGSTSRATCSTKGTPTIYFCLFSCRDVLVLAPVFRFLLKLLGDVELILKQ